MLLRRVFSSSAAAGGKTTFTAQQLGEMALHGVDPKVQIEENTRYTTLPKLSDSMVNVTLVDLRGKRFRIAGLVGQTLVEASQSSGVKLLDDDSNGGGNANEVVRNTRWTEKMFGEGPVSFFSHVIVPKEHQAKIPPPLWAEQEMLQFIAPQTDRTPHSRLATEIILTKEMNNMVVLVPDRPPTSQEKWKSSYNA